MPTYAYACTACDHRFEAQQSFTDDALTECPQCQSRLRKLFNAVGIVFKGSGFYRTDSRNGSDGGAGGSAKGESANGSTSEASGSTDSGSSTSSGSSSADSPPSTSTSKSPKPSSKPPSPKATSAA